MQTRTFGPAGTPLPVIGIGTWNMERDDNAAAIAAIRRAIEVGMTHIDTAELYGSGAVEKLVAEAIRGARERIFLVSKVMPTNASKAGTIRACEDTLSRLGTDHLDVYLLHWPGRFPLEGTIAAFEKLVEQGKIKSYGVSNFDVDEMEQAVKIAGEGRIVCNQVLYHLEERYIEHRLWPWCQKRRIAIVGYSPFGSSSQPWSSRAAQRVLEEIAAARGVTAHAVALAFLVRADGLFTIPKTSNASHVDANAAAGSLELSAEELARIDAAFPRGKEQSSLPTA